jgi:hypothetical protein
MLSKKLQRKEKLFFEITLLIVKYKYNKYKNINDIVDIDIPVYSVENKKDS